MSHPALSRKEMASMVAQDLPRFAAVNLGIGMPTLVADALKPESGVQLHSENGILGMRGLQAGELGDRDLINASKEFVALLPGASIFDHALSFAIMRGGHLDVTVLGAFELAANGDLANWSLGDNDPLPSVGGAMDLAMGAKTVWVIMETQTREGYSKLVEQCTLPLTGLSVVSRVYTQIGSFDLEDGAFVPRALLEGLCEADVRQHVAGPLRWRANVARVASLAQQERSHA
ncbi:MAG: CoA-transferase [Comamonas sp.]